METQILFATDQVVDKVIDETEKLNSNQLKKFKEAFNKISENPFSGGQEGTFYGADPSISIRTEFWFEYHLGEMKHLTIFYDMQRQANKLFINVKAISVHFKM